MQGAAYESPKSPPGIGMSRPHNSLLLASCLADRPDIGGYGVEVVIGQQGAAHRRHRARIALGVRHALADRLGQRREAAVAPDPCAAVEWRTHRRAVGVGAVAAGAGAVIDLAVEDAL